MGWGHGAATRGGAPRVAGLASYVCPVRRDRVRVGGLLLSPISQSSRPGRCDRRRPAGLGDFPSIAERLGSLHPVVLSLLRFLLLRDLAAHLPAAGARSRAE